MLIVIVAGLIAIALMCEVELLAARRHHRRAELGTVIMCGLVGIGYFVAMLYTAGPL